MSKLKEGCLMPNFTFQSLFEGKLAFYDVLNGKKTVLLFHRFIGCRLCQFDIRNLAQGYEHIIASGGNVFVVVQSPPETIRDYYTENLPFTIICDPEQILYKQFEIPIATSIEKFQGGKYKEKLEEITRTDLVRGRDEGEPMQLPAIILINEAQKITYTHYAANGADVPDVSEIAQLLK